MNFKPPSPFRPGLVDNVMQQWTDWKEDFEMFLTVSDKQKVAMLLYSMGREYMKVYKTFMYDPEKSRDIVADVQKSDAYFEPKTLYKIHHAVSTMDAETA